VVPSLTIRFVVEADYWLVTAISAKHGPFIGLGKDYTHLAVNHSAGEYVRLGGFVHTQNIESARALLKRQITGIHHWVSTKHLQRYVDEMAWRYNRRDMKPSPRMNDIFACVEGRLTYKALIALRTKEKS
jgi:hypothetical protein